MEQKMGRLNRLPKTDVAVLKRQLTCLQTYLHGIKYMTRLFYIVIIVDQHEEDKALRECITLGIPTIYLINTNCDPDLVDISIPANDDAISSIRLILNKSVFTICEGYSSYIIKKYLMKNNKITFTLKFDRFLELVIYYDTPKHARSYRLPNVSSITKTTRLRSLYYTGDVFYFICINVFLKEPLN